MYGLIILTVKSLVITKFGEVIIIIDWGDIFLLHSYKYKIVVGL